MKTAKIKLSTLIRFIIVCALGVLSHFLYNWSGQNKFVGIFTSMNESTWEHLKLIFFPILFVTIFDLVVFRKKAKALLPARVMGILSGMIFIIVTFYTFWGISGRIIDFINISIYVFGVFTAFVTEKFYCKKNIGPDLSVSIAILIAITALFVIFSFNAPDIGIFYDLSLHPKS